MLPIINLGPIAIQAAGLLLVLSLLAGIWLTGKLAQALGTNGEGIENSLLIGLFSGIAAARIGFLLQHPAVFRANPLSLVSLTPSMFNISFGLLAAGLSSYIYARQKHLPLWPTLDTLSPLGLLLFAGIHLANYAIGNAYGLPTDLPWGIRLWNAVRHPVQVYALVLSAVLFTWLLIRTDKLRTSGFLRSGRLFTSIITGLSFITLFTQAFVAEKTRLAGLDLVQLLALTALVASLAAHYYITYLDKKLVNVLISMGSNLNPENQLPTALKKLRPELTLMKTSSIYRTEPVSSAAGLPHFLNQVIEVTTSLPYPKLVRKLKVVEKALGREHSNKKNVALDLDVLTYNSDVFVYRGKHIPDPNLKKYAYIAIPLAEIQPSFIHPGTGETIQTIIEKIGDPDKVVKTEEVEKWN